MEQQQGGPPTRPDSEYGDRPAGAPPGPPRGEGAPASGRTPDALDQYADRVVAILARGEDLGASTIASEIDLEATQVSSLLHRLEHDGRVMRTASGNWSTTPAAQATTEPAPSPKEPPQDEGQ